MTRSRNKTARETRTIQVWPGGASYEYRGDPDGPGNQRSLRAGYYQARVRCGGGCERITGYARRDDKAGAHFHGEIGYVELPFEDDRVGQYCTAIEYASQGNPDQLSTVIAVCDRCAGAGYVPNPIRNPWRKGTQDEWRSIRVELRAELYWNREGRGCDSSLVDDLIKLGGDLGRGGELAAAFSYEEIRGLYADPSDWDAERCREYAEDYGVELPEVPTIEVCPTCKTDDCDHFATLEAFEDVPDPAAAEDDSPRGWLTEARDACREYAQDNPAEVFEWWRVSDWLCEELASVGEVTISNGYGDWWGRCTTGQGLIMDGVLQKVAAKHERGE